jgi:hypothetical protein
MKYLTVSELIQILNKMPHDAKVTFRNDAWHTTGLYYVTDVMPWVPKDYDDMDKKVELLSDYKYRMQ